MTIQAGEYAIVTTAHGDSHRFEGRSVFVSVHPDGALTVFAKGVDGQSLAQRFAPHSWESMEHGPIVAPASKLDS